MCLDGLAIYAAWKPCVPDMQYGHPSSKSYESRQRATDSISRCPLPTVCRHPSLLPFLCIPLICCSLYILDNLAGKVEKRDLDIFCMDNN